MSLLLQMKSNELEVYHFGYFTTEFKLIGRVVFGRTKLLVVLKNGKCWQI